MNVDELFAFPVAFCRAKRSRPRGGESYYLRLCGWDSTEPRLLPPTAGRARAWSVMDRVLERESEKETGKGAKKRLGLSAGYGKVLLLSIRRRSGDSGICGTLCWGDGENPSGCGLSPYPLRSLVSYSFPVSEHAPCHLIG